MSRRIKQQLELIKITSENLNLTTVLVQKILINFWNNSEMILLRSIKCRLRIVVSVLFVKDISSALFFAQT